MSSLMMKNKIYNIIARILHLIIAFSPIMGSKANTEQGLYEPIEGALCMTVFSLSLFIYSFFVSSYSKKRDYMVAFSFISLAFYNAILLYWNEGTVFYIFPIPILLLIITLVITKFKPFVIAYFSMVIFNLIVIFLVEIQIPNFNFILLVSTIGVLGASLAKVGFIKTQEQIRSKTKALEESNHLLKQSTLNLQESNARLEEFAYITSHDLKAPVRSVKGYLDFLAEDYAPVLPNEAKDFLSKADQQLIKMDRLIDSLLLYSRAANIEHSYQNINLLTLAEKSSASLKADNVEFIFNQLPTVKVDESRMMEVFYNLFSNAIKYNASEKKTIEVSFNKEHSLLSIKDNGIGIEEKNFDKVFQFFKRLNADKEFGEGSGAGMALVKRILDRHKINISIESELDLGTTLILDLSKIINS